MMKPSKILLCILKCLREKKHLHMLKWICKNEFEVTLKHRRNPTWTSKDISLFVELDSLFPKRGYDPHDEGGCRSRFISRMQRLCTNFLTETTLDCNIDKEPKSITKRRFKINDSYKKSNPYKADSFENASEEIPEKEPVEFQENLLNMNASHYLCLSNSNYLITPPTSPTGEIQVIILPLPFTSSVVNENIYLLSPPTSKEMEKVTKEEKKNNFHASPLTPSTSKEVEKVTMEGNKYYYPSPLTPSTSKEMENVTVDGNGYSCYTSSLTPSTSKEMEIVPMEDNGYSYCPSPLISSTSKEMEVTQIKPVISEENMNLSTFGLRQSTYELDYEEYVNLNGLDFSNLSYDECLNNADSCFQPSENLRSQDLLPFNELDPET